MKHKVLIGSIITTLFAFMLYSATLKRVEQGNVKIIDQSQQKVSKQKVKAAGEPHVAEVEYASDIKVTAGSQQAWAQRIKQVMGKEQSYQVFVQDVNTRRFAEVANVTKGHGIGLSSRLFILTTIFYLEQHGQLSGHSVVKIKKLDGYRQERILQAGIGYEITYLKQAMMNGSVTAANALLRKIKPERVNDVLRRMGAAQSKINGRFSTKPVAVTTAKDLAQIMINLEHHQTLNRQYANLTLSTLNQTKTKPPIVAGQSGLIYATGDRKANVALVQAHGQTYCISIWGSTDQKFAKLGRTVSAFFK